MMGMMDDNIDGKVDAIEGLKVLPPWRPSQRRQRPARIRLVRTSKRPRIAGPADRRIHQPT